MIDSTFLFTIDFDRFWYDFDQRVLFVNVRIFSTSLAKMIPFAGKIVIMGFNDDKSVASMTTYGLLHLSMSDDVIDQQTRHDLSFYRIPQDLHTFIEIFQIYAL